MRMQGVDGVQRRITAAVLEWEGMAVQPHRFGGVEYVLGKREIGHIHGDYLVDIPFPSKVSAEIVAAGRASPHHIFPESGWVSFYVREEGDVERAIGLLEESYGIAMRKKGAKGEAAHLG